ncbi:MAG: hypothetical protein OXG37_15175 [Actinomycetia bacterium]|nr:hypothetical protein [Actinomycetes bacterium]
MGSGQAGQVEELSFSVDLETGAVESLSGMTLESAGLRERDDLQRWVAERPEIVGPGLLVVTTEFDRWELRERRVLDRLDVLFLDAGGSLVVGELKRDWAADTVELQALKYAAYCSNLTVGEVVEEYARYHSLDEGQAREQVFEHAPSLEDDELGPVRVRLVAGGFGPSVTSVVLWLRDHGIDIGCVQITARRHSERGAVVSARQLIPLPEAEDYLVRRRRREQGEETRRVARRRATTVSLLNRAGAVEVGDPVRLNVQALPAVWRPAVEELIAESAAVGEAEWSGSESTQKALRWKHDGELYSASGITRRILAMTDVEPGPLNGPSFWRLPNGRSLYEESQLIEAEQDPEKTENQNDRDS